MYSSSPAVSEKHLEELCGKKIKIKTEGRSVGSYLRSGTLGSNSLVNFLADRNDRPAEQNRQPQNAGL